MATEQDADDVIIEDTGSDDDAPAAIGEEMHSLLTETRNLDSI